MRAATYDEAVYLAERAAPRGGINDIAKIRAELATQGIDVIDLSDSNPTRHALTHPGVLEAVQRHAGDAARYEPHPRGPAAAREALAAMYGGNPDDYWLTSSTSQAYAWLISLLADPGEVVAMPSPGYPLIPPIARITGVHVVDYHYHYAHPHGWILDGQSLTEAASNPALRAIVAVNPGNPTGSYVRDDRDDLLSAAVRSGVAVISDEVFGPFSLDDLPTTVADQSDAVTFTLGGLSKLLCAPQLKLSWIRLTGPPAHLAALRDALDSIADMFLPVSGPIAAALPELLALAPASVSAVRGRLKTNLSILRETLDSNNYRVRRCGGGWTVVIDVPRDVPSTRLAEHLLRTAHIAVHPGWLYDLSREGAFALSLLPGADRFAEGVTRMREAVSALAGASSYSGN